MFPKIKIHRLFMNVQRLFTLDRKFKEMKTKNQKLKREII